MMSMNLRLTTALLLAALTVVGCSGGDDVPDDQVVKPAAAPGGWTETDLGPVTVAAPAEWEKQESTQPTETLTSTAWRAAEVDGASPGGMEVRVISAPQQSADKAAQALAISAMSTLEGAGEEGALEPEEVVWPNAKAAYYLAYTSSITTAADAPPSAYLTRTLVLDLADGSQVQVTALAEESAGAEAPDRAVSSVQLVATDDES